MKIVKGPRAKTCIHIFSALALTLVGVVAVAAILLGIWTNDDRWIGTGFTLGGVGLFPAIGTAASWETNHNRRCNQCVPLPWRAQPQDDR